MGQGPLEECRDPEVGATAIAAGGTVTGPGNQELWLQNSGLQHRRMALS